jgi:hypothetical protein
MKSAIVLLNKKHNILDLKFIKLKPFPFHHRFLHFSAKQRTNICGMHNESAFQWTPKTMSNPNSVSKASNAILVQNYFYLFIRKWVEILQTRVASI